MRETKPSKSRTGDSDDGPGTALAGGRSLHLPASAGREPVWCLWVCEAVGAPHHKAPAGANNSPLLRSAHSAASKVGPSGAANARPCRTARPSVRHESPAPTIAAHHGLNDPRHKNPKYLRACSALFMQHTAWPAHKRSCKVVTKAQAALDDRAVISDHAAMQLAAASLANADPADEPPLEPAAAARLFVLRHIHSEKEDAAGRIAHEEHCAAFRPLIRVPAAALAESVSVAGSPPTLIRTLALNAGHNWALACIRWCMSGSRALPPAVLAAHRALAFSAAQPPFVRFFSAWTVAASLQFPESADPGGFGPAEETISFAAMADPLMGERIRCHALMEELAAAARAEAPDDLGTIVDAALAEAVAFNKLIREAPSNATIFATFVPPN